MTDLNQFFNEWNGKGCEVEDPTAKDQCFDLALAYCDFLNIPRLAIRHLYAYQIDTNPTDLTVQYFDIIPNTPNGVPQKGDLIVWGNQIGKAGHVAIGTGQGDTKSFTSFDQNWPLGTTCHYQGHDYTGVLGFLRPRQFEITPITDQTVIPLPEPYGPTEVQAIVSMLKDRDQKIQELEAAKPVDAPKTADNSKVDVVVTSNPQPTVTFNTPPSPRTLGDVIKEIVSVVLNYVKSFQH